MKKLIFFILISSICCFNLRHAKQRYDSYVMAVQWPNAVCVNGCQGRDSIVEKNTLTIHGLWPSLKTGNQLAPCTSGVTIRDDGSELFKNLRKYWPSLTGENTKFWEHEYNKHGYCMVEEKGWSGYRNYFQKVLDIFQNYKNLLINIFPSQKTVKVTYDEMKQAVKKKIPNALFKMNCKSNYLTEFYFYLDKDFAPIGSYHFSNNCNSATVIFK